MDRYDYILCGGGCAGLSMLYYLLESKFADSKILIIDPAYKEEINKTWCYWNPTVLSIHPSSAIYSWKAFSLSSHDQEINKTLQGTDYFHLNSKDFFSAIYSKTATKSNITFLKDQVIGLNESPENVIIETEKSGQFHGKLVFDSRIGSNPDAQHQLNQVFVGYKVKTQQEAFDPKQLTLMDFNTESFNPFDFFYILPFSENEALIEYTIYSSRHIPYEILESHLKNFLYKKFADNKFEITYVEKGTIPMTTLSLTSPAYKRVIPIGTKAGWTKPSTGYTFHQIQINCQLLVKRLEENKFDHLVIKRKSRFSFYDSILLNIAHRWPEKLKLVFINMFETSSPDMIFRFLSEETSFWEELKILSKLKFSIFIKSLFYYESR